MGPEDSENSTHYSETVGTRLSPETKTRFDEYKEENQLGNAKAARRLIRESLENNSVARSPILLTTLIAGLVWIVTYISGDLRTAAAIGGIYIAVIGSYAIWPSLREHF